MSDGGLTLSGLDTSNPKDNTDVNFDSRPFKNQILLASNSAGQGTLKIEKKISEKVFFWYSLE